MDRRAFPPLRALPRVFFEGFDAEEPFELPEAELNKLRKVLRLGTGDPIAVLPNDGSVWTCVLEGRRVRAVERHEPQTEPKLKVTVAQALPKADKLDEIVRACTEIGVTSFVFFPAVRSVVQWDEAKRNARIQRLATIAREASEVSFRTMLPTITIAAGLREVLAAYPDAVALSEVEGVARALPKPNGPSATLVVGPEGGWAPEELKLIGDRGATLGPRVLRVDHAAAAAAAIWLLSHSL